MPPSDVIVALYFLSDEVAKIMSTNEGYFVPADRGYERAVLDSDNESEELAHRGMPRSASPPPDLDWRCGPRLELHWNADRKTKSGFIIGSSNLLCDIHIPKSKFRGASARLGMISFDDKNRLIYSDLRDTEKHGDGSAVLYDGMGGQKRRGFTWVLYGTDYIKTEIPEIVLQLRDDLKLVVYVPPHDWTSAEHAAKVEAFVSYKRSDNADYLEDPAPMNRLSLQSASTTAPPSGAATLAKSPILLTINDIARGSFGIVRRLYDVSNGTYIARKVPVGDLRKREKKLWKTEVRLLTRINNDSHLNPDCSRHVVRMYYGTVDPPIIDLEYVPYGTLRDQHRKPLLLSDHETRSVLEQTLKALSFLHGLDKPITHRDVKANNILVQYRAAVAGVGAAEGGDEIIYIKLADFGLSKDGDLKTERLGTDRYRAPELFPAPPPRPRRGLTARRTSHTIYTPAVDIWAAGVMVYELVRGRLKVPDHKRDSDMCRWVLNTIQPANEQSDLAAFVAQFMVLWDAHERLSARDCLRALSRPPATDAGADAGVSADTLHPGSLDGGGFPESFVRPPNSQAAAAPSLDGWRPDDGRFDDWRVPTEEAYADGEWQGYQPALEVEAEQPTGDFAPFPYDDQHVSEQQYFDWDQQRLPPPPHEEAQRRLGTYIRQLYDERGGRSVATSDYPDLGRPQGLRLPDDDAGGVGALDSSADTSGSSQETTVPPNLAAQSPRSGGPGSPASLIRRETDGPATASPFSIQHARPLPSSPRRPSRSTAKRFLEVDDDDDDGGQPHAPLPAKRHQPAAPAASSPSPTTPSGRSGAPTTSVYEYDEDDEDGEGGDDGETRASSSSYVWQPAQEAEPLPSPRAPINAHLHLRYDEDDGEVPTVIFGDSFSEMSQFSRTTTSWRRWKQEREEAYCGQQDGS